MRNFKYTALLGLMLSSGAFAAAQNEGFVNIDEYTMHGTMNISSKSNNNGAYIRSRAYWDPVEVSFSGRDEQGDEFSCRLSVLQTSDFSNYDLGQDMAHATSNGTEIYLERKLVVEDSGFESWECSTLIFNKDTSYFN